MAESHKYDSPTATPWGKMATPWGNKKPYLIKATLVAKGCTHNHQPYSLIFHRIRE